MESANRIGPANRTRTPPGTCRIGPRPPAATAVPGASRPAERPAPAPRPRDMTMPH